MSFNQQFCDIFLGAAPNDLSREVAMPVLSAENHGIHEWRMKI